MVSSQEKKIKKVMTNESTFETCILCGNTTDIPKTRHIDLRPNYIVGVGQLCSACAYRLTGKEHE